jgi:CubicO group peptidase (beta-lactamase class C family)
MRIALALLSLALVHAQDITAKADELAQKNDFMGSVLVAKGGKVILKKGYGMANIELDVPNAPDTKFRLGSITKQFTATAILQLAAQGKLSVDDKASKYIANAPDAWKDITIHHLLTHTSGIPNYTAFPDFQTTMRVAVTPIELVAKFKDHPLDFPPGSKFKYSNSGYEVLGVIIEKVSGEKYEDYLKKHIFDPLDMQASGYDHDTTILKHRASGYERGKDGKIKNAEYLDMSIPYSAGSLYSTVEDLYLWDRSLYTDKMLTREWRDKMFTPFLSNYAYGWTVKGEGADKTISHNGGINGFLTSINRYPNSDACVIVLTNLTTKGVTAMSSGLQSALFGDK